MLYVIYGNDVNKTRDRARGIVSSLRLKKPEASYIEIENFALENSLETYAGSCGLFAESVLALLDNVLELADGRDNFVKQIDNLAKSQNVFVLLHNGKIPIDILNKLKKVAEKIEEHSVGFKKNSGFSNFDLADALGARDRRKLWILYLQALKNKTAMEEIVGVLFWQLKSIYLSLTALNINDSGLKPFVYSKSKNFAKNFKQDELTDLMFDLVQIYHKAHAGEEEMEISLEKFILSRV